MGYLHLLYYRLRLLPVELRREKAQYVPQAQMIELYKEEPQAVVKQVQKSIPKYQMQYVNNVVTVEPKYMEQVREEEDLFDAIDRDHNGQISKEEWKEAQIAQNLTQYHKPGVFSGGTIIGGGTVIGGGTIVGGGIGTAAAFNAVDRDGNGVITRNEFNAAVRPGVVSGGTIIGGGTVIGGTTGYIGGGTIVGGVGTAAAFNALDRDG